MPEESALVLRGGVEQQTVETDSAVGLEALDQLIRVGGDDEPGVSVRLKGLRATLDLDRIADPDSLLGGQ